MSAPSARLYGTAGPVVALIHGWCCTGAFWARQIDALAQRLRVLVIELGHPDDVSMERAGEAVADVLRPHGPCGLVGHSMGGVIALEAAQRLGERCRAVIGVDTFTDAAFYASRPSAEIEARLAPFRRDFAAAMTAMVEDITLVGGADLRRWIAGEMATAPPDPALARMAALLAHDISAVWPETPCSLHAINSARLTRPDATLSLPGLQTVLMPEVGHFPMLEAPEAFLGHLERALRVSGL